MKMNDLKEIINSILDTYDLKDVPDNVDMYWYVDTDTMFDMSSSPNELLVGSIDDDLESISTIISKERVCSSVDFERIAFILLAFAHYLRS